MLKALFTLEAAADFLFGISFIAAPAAILSLYGMSTDRDGTFLGQFLGGTFIGFGLISWFARTWADTESRRTVIRVFFITTALGFIVSLNYQIQPGAPLPTVAFVGLTLLFGVGWGYFAYRSFRQPRPSNVAA
jgi:FtsH-binding integral membrane protein